MGPNEGKSFFDQTKCVARALMSYSSAHFGDPSIWRQKMDEYISQHGSVANKWFKFKCSWGDWYVHYEVDALELGGKSCEKLPDGTKVAAVFDLRSSEKIFQDKFEKAVSCLESGFTPNIFLDYAHGLFGGAELSPAVKESAMVLDDAFKGEIQNLKKSVEACRSGFNGSKIVEFRNWLRKFPDTVPPEKPDLLIVNDPDRLVAFSKQLAEEHSKYCVDTYLFGSVATIADICRCCASKAQEKSKENDQALPFKVFNNLALILTSSTETHPVKILEGTVQKAIDCGFVDELLEIVSNYREKVEDKIKAVLDSETTDKSLEVLYEAIPFAHGAHIILANLCRNAERFYNDEARLVEASYTMVDEDLTRICQAFENQILDFNGAQWKRCRRCIAEAKRDKGIEAAKKLIDFVVEQNLLYPRRFIPALLSENETV